MRQCGLSTPCGWDILLVLPNATKSDVILHSLALTRAWSNAYRVSVLFRTADGPLINAFRATCAEAWVPDDPTRSTEQAVQALDILTRETSFLAAVCVSTECRDILEQLTKRNIPTIAYISELASRSNPVTAVSETIALADQVVVPSKLVLDDAYATDYLMNPGRNHNVIEPAFSDLQALRHLRVGMFSRIKARQKLRDNFSSRSVIMGSGPINFESGLDLFLEASREILESSSDIDLLCVWVDTDPSQKSDLYLSILKSQIHMLGLTSKVIIQSEETCDIQAVMEEADVFFLSSRSAPLPFIGIAALNMGLPVVSFRHASAFSEYLEDSCFERVYVAEYLSPHDAAVRISNLLTASNGASIRSLANIGHAEKVFNTKVNADRLLSLMKDNESSREIDFLQIRDSTYFNTGFFNQDGNRGVNREEAIRSYLRRVWTGCNIRKPEPGFHPLKYLNRKNINPQTDPYADFLRAGRPKGPWSIPVIRGEPDATNRNVTKSRPSTALHIHAYYTEQLADILERIELNYNRPDLYTSVKSLKDKEILKNTVCLSYEGQVTVEVVPNLGRDIGPFLTHFGKRLVEKYELVGHVHTKKSLHANNSEMIDQWVHFLFSGVRGGQTAGAMLDQIFAQFAEDSALGIVFPDDPHVFGWTSNRPEAQLLATSMGLEQLPNVINFPVGTMFWMRSQVLQDFVDLDLDWSFYPPEPVPSDGTVLHALERLFGVVPELKGWGMAVTYSNLSR